MRKSRLAYLFMFIIALFIAPLSVQAYTIPEPSDDLYVSDFANVIDSDVEQDIIDTNMRLEEMNGVQIAVVTVDFLDGADIEDYAYELFNQWGIGSAESNNGVLLLLAIGEDNYYCLAGTGLNNVLSSGRIKLLLNEYLEPDFASGDYSAGVSKTFNAIYNIVSELDGTPIIYDSNNHENTNNVRPNEMQSNIFSIFLLLGISLFILICISALIRPRSYRRRPHMRGYFGPPIIIHDHHDHYGRYDRHDRGPRPPRSGYGGGFNNSSSSSSSSGNRSFGGGSSRGGGAGRSFGSSRSSSSFGGGRSSGAGRSSGRSFGGGSSRGGGAGRK